jgi:hypothetical protein
MSVFSHPSQQIFLGKTALALCLLSSLSSQGSAQRAPAGPFTDLSGHWSGAGTITMSNGSSERIRCRATYAVNAGGKALQQSLRCASDSYRLVINANVEAEGGAISGTWDEATRNASGNLSGRATSAEIQARVTGAAFSAGIDVRTRGGQQTVSIRPQSGADVANVSIVMHKG